MTQMTNNHEDPRLGEILDVIFKFASGDLTARGKLFGDESALDGVMAGINILGEELEANVAESKQAQQALSESEALLRSIFDSVQDGIILAESKSRKFRMVNAAMCRMLGYSYDELLNMGVEDIHPKDGLDYVISQFERLSKGEIGIAPDLPVQRKDGSIFYSDVSSGPMKMDGAACIVGIFRDITERKRAEDAIRAKDESYRLLFESSRDALMTLAPPSWRFTSANQATLELFGAASTAAFTELGPWNVSPERQPDGRPSDEKAQEMIATAMRDGKNFFEWEHQRLNGEPFAADVLLTRMNLGGEVFLQATVRDITERKQAEEEIRMLNKSLEEKVRLLVEAQEELVRKEKLSILGQVAGSVGHELRNPLGVMNNAVYFLQTVLSDADQTTKEYLGIIKDEIATADRIVGDLLDSVRTKPPQFQTISVTDLIEQTLNKLTVPETVTITRDIPAELPPVKVDPMQMQQVFRNLITNGIEAMAEGGPLEISAKQDGKAKNVVVSIRDTGTGITPENMARLFQPLFTTKSRGIGLGLVVVKNLAQANGGKVEVQSEVGKGTTFTVTLPT